MGFPNRQFGPTPPRGESLSSRFEPSEAHTRTRNPPQMSPKAFQNLKNAKSWLKWVQKNAPGVLRPQGGSKLRCESSGMPPGPQNGNKKLENAENLEHPEHLELPNFSYRSLWVPMGP